jgi:hypothetical protein
MKNYPKYNSPRARAWRHAMMGAINAGLEQELFGLKPGENYWPGAEVIGPSRRSGGAYYGGCRFEFTLGGIPGLAWVGDAGYDELKVHSVLWPDEDEEIRSRIFSSGLYSFRHPIGGVCAEGWFERREGCYLMPSYSLFRRRIAHTPALAALKVEPHGYADHGRFRM